MIVVSDKYDILIADAAERWGVPFAWVKAIAGAESDWTATAYRAEPQIADASYGLMQILYRTALGLGYKGTPEGLYDPAVNVDLGAKLINDLIRRYGEDFKRVYSAYNSGSPTKYLTSSQVASHVARAVRYLQAVEGGITYVEPNGTTPGSESGIGTSGIMLLILAAAAGWILSRGAS